MLHVAVAGMAAWLVLRYSPFTRLQKLLLVFGYFPLYEYGVIVRPYGMGMMLTFAACATWTLARRRIVWTAVVLVLLANTTVMGTLIALTLLLAFVIDWAWPDGEAPWHTLRKHPAGLVVAGLVALAVFWIAAALGLRLTPVDEAFHAAGFGPAGDLWAVINGSRFRTQYRPWDRPGSAA